MGSRLIALLLDRGDGGLAESGRHYLVGYVNDGSAALGGFGVTKVIVQRLMLDPHAVGDYQFRLVDWNTKQGLGVNEFLFLIG